MDSVSEADLVAVTDTGSSDGTVEKLRSRGAVVHQETINPWRFDAARNIAMDHVPEDADICVCCDLDEVFEPGWRRKLEDAWQPCYTQARYMFVWSFNADGSPKKQYAIQKIHRRHGFRWFRPVHEMLVYSGEGDEACVWVDGLVLRHYPDLGKPRTQYLPLLELAAEENPEDDRVAFWLGREYMYHGRYDEAIGALKRHLSLKSAVWDEERCASMRYIARSLQLGGDVKQAKLWLYKAIAECPNVREPYLQTAKLGYLEGDWPLVFFMVEKALAIKRKSGSYLTEPEAWDYSLYDLGAISLYRLGLFEKAREYALAAISHRPEDPRLKRNLELIEQKLALSKQEAV